MSEKQVQAKCVLWFSQEYPERRGDLAATFQETLNGAQGSNMLSLGLIPGVSDLLYLNSGVLTGIEMKAENTRHDIYHILEQCKFILNNCYDGWFCTTLPMFKDIVNKTGVGIDPMDIVRKCEDAIGNKIALHGADDIDDLLFKINQWVDKEYPKRKKKNPNIKKSSISIGTIKF